MDIFLLAIPDFSGLATAGGVVIMKLLLPTVVKILETVVEILFPQWTLQLSHLGWLASTGGVLPM